VAPNKKKEKQRKKCGLKRREHTSVDTIEELKGTGFPSTLSLGFSCSTRPRRLQTSSSGGSSGYAQFGSEGPLYNHIGRVLSANCVTRRW